MGFVGKEFVYKKPQNTIRIACLGGSTTERGYPAITEYQLNKFFKGSLTFEVMNFGVSGWTTANSMVNYALNVKSFNPDYVLIHHGWNEERVRNSPDSLFRTDYSHALTYFHEPEIIDKTPIRLSLLYRILKIKFSYTPDWAFLGDATVVKNRPKTSDNFHNQKELTPFKHNIESIVDLSLQNGSKVILSTMPFSLSNESLASLQIEQANEVVKTIHLLRQNNTLLLDLDNVVTGNIEDIFLDLAHMNDKGIFYKGSEFARVIINDIKGASLESVLPSIFTPFSYHSYVKNTFQNESKYADLLKNAKERGLEKRKMLKKQALFLIKERSNKKENLAFEKLYQEYRIRSNPEWMKNVKRHAKEKNISVQESLRQNINHIFKSK
jgi:hypothetical protein